MAKTAHDLREEVLALPALERARIASDLLASLDSEAVDGDEIDQLWSAETQRRAAMLESGDAGTLTWDDIQQRFAERRAQRGAAREPSPPQLRSRPPALTISLRASSPEGFRSPIADLRVLGSNARTTPGGIRVISGHWRAITVNVTEPFVAPSAELSPTLGYNGLQRGCTDAKRPGQK